MSSRTRLLYISGAVTLLVVLVAAVWATGDPFSWEGVERTGWVAAILTLLVVPVSLVYRAIWRSENLRAEEGEAEGEGLNVHSVVWENSKQARRERQVRILKDDEEDVVAICLAALREGESEAGILERDRRARIVEARMTRGGLMVRGEAATDYLWWKMRSALHSLGYVVGESLFGGGGIVVTGWDPGHYGGSQLTVERIDARIDELLELRKELAEEGREDSGARE